MAHLNITKSKITGYHIRKERDAMGMGTDKQAPVPEDNDVEEATDPLLWRSCFDARLFINYDEMEI